jgi:hypothetical protein
MVSVFAIAILGSTRFAILAARQLWAELNKKYSSHTITCNYTDTKKRPNWHMRKVIRAALAGGLLKGNASTLVRQLNGKGL